MKLDNILAHPFAAMLIIGAIGSAVCSIISATTGTKVEPVVNIQFKEKQP